MLGSLHGDRAYVAARAGDLHGFETHYAAMEHHFRATENPWLIQQCAALRTQAVRLGLPLAGTAARREQLSEELDGSTEIASVYRASDEADSALSDGAGIVETHTRPVANAAARDTASIPGESVIAVRGNAGPGRASKR